MAAAVVSIFLKIPSSNVCFEGSTFEKILAILISEIIFALVNLALFQNLWLLPKNRRTITSQKQLTTKTKVLQIKMTLKKITFSSKNKHKNYSIEETKRFNQLRDHLWRNLDQFVSKKVQKGDLINYVKTRSRQALVFEDVGRKNYV